MAPRIGILLALALLTACSSAYIDSRREAGKRIRVGPSNADVVAICTGSGASSPEVMKLATEKCAETKRVPKYETKRHLACNLSAPTRVFYRCVTPDEATSGTAASTSATPDAKPASTGSAPPAAAQSGGDQTSAGPKPDDAKPQH
jgi:hypothetical protein